MIKHLKYDGLLIVFEGPDGCGKDEQIRRLVERLRAEYPDREIVVTYEPWDVIDSPSGSRIRRLLRNQEPYCEIEPGDGKIIPARFQTMYVENRYIHWAKLVLPALMRGAIVICSRERMSTYAYGRAFGVSVAEIDSWHAMLPNHDLIIFLDTPVSVCTARFVARAQEEDVELEYFETEDKIRRIVNAYRYVHRLGLLNNVTRVSGAGSRKAVHERVWPHVAKKVESRERGR